MTAKMAASRKEAKYAALQTHHIFQPIAVETLGPINESARAFLDDLWMANFCSERRWQRAFVFISTHFCCYSAF